MPRMKPSRVYLVRTTTPARPTWFAVHTVGPITKMTQTHLVAFTDRAHAEACAHGLEAYRDRHDAYPAREFSKWPAALDWMAETPASPAGSPHLEIVEMPMDDVLAMMTGTGLSCRLLRDPSNLRSKIDVKQPFDRAATCTRLTYLFERLEI